MVLNYLHYTSIFSFRQSFLESFYDNYSLFFLLRPSYFYGKICFVLITNTAAVAELVDALDSKSSGE